jgi:hypothetical protein
MTTHDTDATHTTDATPRFRTICRIGYWLHVDAMWNAGPKDFGLTANYVYFNLVDGFGHAVHAGFSIITTDDAGAVVTDEDGESFADLETAIRCHAEELLKLEWQWTEWQDVPPRHRSAGDGKATEVAFTPQNIAYAVKLATREPDNRLAVIDVGAAREATP